MAMPYYPFTKDFEQLHGCNRAAKFATQCCECCVKLSKNENEPQ